VQESISIPIAIAIAIAIAAYSNAKRLLHRHAPHNDFYANAKQQNAHHQRTPFRLKNILKKTLTLCSKSTILILQRSNKLKQKFEIKNF